MRRMSASAGARRSRRGSRPGTRRRSARYSASPALRRARSMQRVAQVVDPRARVPPPGAPRARATSTVGRAPGPRCRHVKCSRASTDSDRRSSSIRCASASNASPRSACDALAVAVLKRSRGRNTRHDTNRPYGRDGRTAARAGAPGGQDAHRDLEQLVDVDLEQVVARVGVEDLAPAPSASWLAGVKPARSTTASTLRRSTGISLAARVVRRRRVEPEEAALADDLAVGVEALDADVVEVARAGGPSSARWPWSARAGLLARRRAPRGGSSANCATRLRRAAAQQARARCRAPARNAVVAVVASSYRGSRGT